MYEIVRKKGKGHFEGFGVCENMDGIELAQDGSQ
jgi:hypothetical protein